MKRAIFLMALVALILPSTLMAVDIELVPSSNSVALDSAVSVDVVVSGLSDLSTPSLGAFDVLLEYDDTLFTFQDLEPGSELGDPDLMEALVTVTPMASQIQVVEVSLLLPATLNGAQPDSFVLFTAMFDAMAEGEGTFNISNTAILSDEVGSALNLDNVVPAIVSVDAGQPVVEVPTLSEWGAIMLLISLMFCALLKIRRGTGSGTAFTIFICVSLLGTLISAPVQAVDGDLEPDGDVDLIDVQAIYAELGNAVGAGHPMDLDDDGVITVLDVRIAVACCNLAGCAVIGNSPPTITAIADQTIGEDGTTGALAFTVGDDNTATAALTVTAVSSNQALIPNANLSLGGAGAARTIGVAPVADASGGPVTITVTVDDGFLTSDETFTVTVDPVNDPPSFTVGTDQTVDEDAGAQTVPAWATALSAGPADEAGQTLTFNITNNTNPALFSAGPAVDESGGLTFTSADDANGTATITLELTDDGGGTDTSSSQSFDIHVNAVNDTPSFTIGAAPTVPEDAGAQTVPAWATGLSAGPADEAGQTLTFNVTNNTNPTLFAAGPAVDQNGELTYTPAADANGTATITLELSDDGGGADTSPSQNFDIHVNAVNDTPSFTVGADQAVLEDAGAQTVPAWATGLSAGPADEAGQTLTFNVTNNTNPTLFAAGPAIDENGELTYTPAADANGTATITLELSDDGGGADTSLGQSFDIDVTAVNDAPSFTVGGDLNFNTDTDPLAQSIANFITGISAGGAGEDGQTLTFSVTDNTNTGLFSVQPTIDSSGTLSFTIAFAANGTATITVELSDNGGTANGGADTAASQTFSIDISSPL